MSNKKRALITGISGMDGSYLSEFLLEQDYELYGIIRRHSNFENELGNVSHLKNEIRFEYGDLTDQSSIESVLMRAKPHEIYHLGAQSQVRISFEIPHLTFQINALGTLNVLDAIVKHCPYARMYNASTSEMFGNSNGDLQFQNENTSMVPVSPYGVSKLAAFNMCNVYRSSYSVFVSSGILFNHESPRRGGNFVTMKIVRGVKAIVNGTANTLELGNLDAARDWGHAKDYVRGMWMMLQHDKPEDFVLATGKTHTVRQFVEIAFSEFGLDWKKYVKEDPSLRRPTEVHFLKGDASKAATILGWKPSYDFKSLVADMIYGEDKK